MNAYQTVAPRLLAGFKAIEKLYGSSPQRLNEACRMSFATNDKMMPAELMQRIGNDYDLTAWKILANFNGYQQTALERSRD